MTARVICSKGRDVQNDVNVKRGQAKVFFGGNVISLGSCIFFFQQLCLSLSAKWLGLLAPVLFPTTGEDVFLGVDCFLALFSVKLASLSEMKALLLALQRLEIHISCGSMMDFLAHLINKKS